MRSEPPQALRCLHAEALKWGVQCAHARQSGMGADVPFVSVPSALSTSDPVLGEGGQA